VEGRGQEGREREGRGKEGREREGRGKERDPLVFDYTLLT